MLDLWTEASADIEGERAALRMANAKVAVAGLWPFLTLAASRSEFEHRLALAWDHIANAVPVDLLQPITDSLRGDYAVVSEAAKNAEGEDEAEGTQPPGGDMPDWLETKIKGEGAYYHQGARRWITAAPVWTDGHERHLQNLEAWTQPGNGTNPDIHQQRLRDLRMLRDTKDAYQRGMTNEEAFREDLRSLRPTSSVEFWHEGARRWITAAYDTDGASGGGNPYYFTGGPEAGPATGMTNQFAPHPTGSDPVDPLNQMYPAQPTPWTVPPGGEWKEDPMQFNPPEGGHQAARHAAQVGERAACVECGGGVVYNQHPHGKEWNHTGSNSWLLDDAHVPTPTRNSREAADRYYDEGVETGPPGGKNPYYFSGGGEGATGDAQSGFEQDVAAGVDPEDRVNELYGASPISAGTVDEGHRVSRRVTATPDNPPPDSDPLQGTKFDSPEEEDRWGKAERGEQQTSRDSSALIGMRHGARQGFYDPSDPGVRALALGDQFGADNPFNMGPGPTPPAGAGQQDSNVPTPPTANIPQTTPPRQTPGGGPGSMPGEGVGGPGTDASDSAAKNNMPPSMGRRVAADTYERPDEEDPTGAGDEYDHNTWAGPINTRPRQGPEHRNINTPQRPKAPIPTIGSPASPGADNEDDRREASRVADRLIRELVA